jgi:hypothetical protein
LEACLLADRITGEEGIKKKKEKGPRGQGAEGSREELA